MSIDSWFDGKAALEVVGHPANGLDGGVLGLPLLVGAEVSSLHDVHVAVVVGLLVQHPAGRRANENQNACRRCKMYRQSKHKTFSSCHFY